MVEFFLIFAVALLFSVIATPLARRLALTTGIVDAPSSRKLHTEPTPLLGGAAIYAAFVVALLLFGRRAGVRQMIAILVGATSVSIIGVVYDARGLNNSLKLLGQLGAAAIIIVRGVKVHIFPWKDVIIAQRLI